MRLFRIALVSAIFIATLACNQLSATPPAPTGLPSNGQQSYVDRLKELGGYPCPESLFTCLVIQTPLDHASPSTSPKFRVAFSVLPASGERQGMLVYATGGPGSSGISLADSYVDSMPPSIPEHFDLVFFDQRGAGLSGNIQCSGAITEFYSFDFVSETPEGEAGLLAAAQTLAHDCLNQIDYSTFSETENSAIQKPDYLDYFGTAQAAGDLESFRQAMNEGKIFLYGESYGTQFAQTYAAHYPQHLAGLILDGTVDLTLSGPDYLRQQAEAFNTVLVMTLEACDSDPACAADIGGDPALTVYDRLAARLALSPVEAAFPLSNGGVTPRLFSLSDLETVAVNYLYSESDRTDFLHALAKANRGDFTQMLTFYYDALSLDPDTLEPIPDPTSSDALYYAVECNDYNYYSGSPAERAEAYLREGDHVEASIPRLVSVFYGDLPCIYWPVQPDSVTRPAPLTAPDVPTLVLAATADPATPYSNSLSVFEHLADGYLITKQGGPHVIFGWGHPCPDALVAAFLVDGKTPEQRETTCPGSVIDPYDS